MRYFMLIIGLGVISLSGCHHDEPSHNALGQVNIHQEPLTTDLAEAANAVSRSLIELAKIQEAVLADKTKAWIPQRDRSLAARASIDWAGPMELLIQRIANINGYQVTTFGTAPRVPINIALNQQDTPYETILKQIDYLAGEHAHLKVVHGKQNVIEVYYAQT